MSGSVRWIIRSVVPPAQILLTHPRLFQKGHSFFSHSAPPSPSFKSAGRLANSSLRSWLYRHPLAVCRNGQTSPLTTARHALSPKSILESRGRFVFCPRVLFLLFLPLVLPFPRSVVLVLLGIASPAAAAATGGVSWGGARQGGRSDRTYSDFT